MASPIVVAAIGLAAARVFGMLGQQFEAYAGGQPSQLSRLADAVHLPLLRGRTFES